MLQAPQSNIQRTLVPAGTHIARVVGLIHIGTVKENYLGEEKLQSKIRLTFEFPEETHVFREGEDAKPLVQSQEYTLSMGKKSNLRPIVEGIIGVSLTDEEAKSFNFEILLGMACLVSIKHATTAKGVEYAKISSTSKLMKGQAAKEAYNALQILTYEKWDEVVFNSLPIFIKEKMATSLEYIAMKATPSAEITDKKIPF